MPRQRFTQNGGNDPNILIRGLQTTNQQLENELRQAQQMSGMLAQENDQIGAANRMLRSKNMIFDAAIAVYRELLSTSESDDGYEDLAREAMQGAKALCDAFDEFMNAAAEEAKALAAAEAAKKAEADAAEHAPTNEAPAAEPSKEGAD